MRNALVFVASVAVAAVFVRVYAHEIYTLRPPQR